MKEPPFGYQPKELDKVWIVSDEDSVNPSRILWGHGGWMEPKMREGLDYLFFFRLMGWETRLLRSEKLLQALGYPRLPELLVLCGEVSEYPDALVRDLFTQNRNQGGVMLVRDAQLEKRSIEENGKGKILRFPFSPMFQQAEIPEFSDDFRNLILRELPGPQLCLNWQGSMILRMDDPGSSEPFHHDTFVPQKLQKEEWIQIGEILEPHQARLSIAYVSAWVNEQGEVSPSALQSPSEYEGLKLLLDKKLASLEAHGFTHLHPDLRAWQSASDRATNVNWYREYNTAACEVLERYPPWDRPESRAKAWIKEYFDSQPCTFVFPGEVFTEKAQKWVLEAGFQLIGSYYLGLRLDDRFCWCLQIRTPYLDDVDRDYLAGSWPVVGYCHDFDLINNGLAWMESCLKQWQETGVMEWIDYRELLARLKLKMQLKPGLKRWDIQLQSAVDFPLCADLRLRLMGNVPVDQLRVFLDGKSRNWEVEAERENEMNIRIII